MFSASPDGSNVALFRMKADGSDRRRLPGVGEGGRRPALSRRGDRLVYAHETRDSNIWRLERGSNGEVERPRMVFSSTRGEAYPQFSPDGTRVAFDSSRSGSREVWVCDSDDSNCLKLTSFGGPLGGFPNWSPDGRQIAFDMRPHGEPAIYVVDSMGGQSRRLTEGPVSEVAPTWSRDGQWIYFASTQGLESQLWKTPSAGGGAAVQVTQGGGVYAQESPDGRFVYYARSVTEPSVWKMPVEGGEESQVLPTLLHYGTFAVREQGIFFVSPRDSAGDSTIELFEFESGTTTRIATVEGIGRRGFAVSPDGRSFLFTRVDLAGSDLMLVENFR